MSTNLIIYHQVSKDVDCPDGITAAWVASRALPTAKIIGVNYKDGIDTSLLKKYSMIYLVDFSLPTEQAKELLEAGVKIIILDHHKTALENLSIFKKIIMGKIDISPNQCGATLAWEYFFPYKEAPYFLELVRDRDTWTFIHPETKAFHEAFSFKRHEAKGKESIFQLMDSLAVMSREEIVEKIIPMGESLLAEKERKVKEIAQRWEEFKLGEYTIAIVRLEAEEGRFTSDICAEMYKTLNYPFVGAINEFTGSFDLRSNSKTTNFDVSAIAKTYGGGGHRNASGFPLSALN